MEEYEYSVCFTLPFLSTEIGFSRFTMHFKMFVLSDVLYFA